MKTEVPPALIAVVVVVVLIVLGAWLWKTTSSPGGSRPSDVNSATRTLPSGKRLPTGPVGGGARQ